MLDKGYIPKQNRLFIIGPAGVGKSTCGPILAKKLRFSFTDLDKEFINANGDVELFVKQNGYLNYCQKNTSLFFKLVEEQKSGIVYAISSGFLMYEQIDSSFSNNAKVLFELGISVLLLPSQSLEISKNIVITRVLKRRPWLNAEREEKKFLERYTKYRKYGEIKIFSTESPNTIAEKIKIEYLDYIAKNPNSLSQ